MLALRRARPFVPVFAAVVVVVALVTGAGVVMLSGMDAAAQAGTRAALDLRAGADLALAARLPLATDEVDQDERVRDAIAGALPRDADWPVLRSVSAEMPLGEPQEDRAALVLRGVDLGGAVAVADGRAPAGESETMIQADAAAGFGLGVGSEVVLGGVPVRVVGTWRAIDVRDPAWVGDDRITSGRGSEPAFVLAEPDWSDFADARPRVQWVIAPTPGTLTVGDLAQTLRSWPTLRVRLADNGVEVTGLSTPGRFTDTAQAVMADVDRARALVPVSIALLFAAQCVALVALTRYLARRRRSEYALLWARGLSASPAAATAALEGGACAAVGAVVGAALGSLIAEGTPVAEIPPVATTLAASAIVVSALASGAAALRVSGPPRAPGARRRRRRAGAPLLATLVGAAAVLSVWQLLLYGSPVVTSPDGALRTDPLTGVAPALLLVGVLFALLLLIPPVATTVDRSASARLPSGALAGRLLLRRMPQMTAALAAVALAVGSLATAASYGQTWEEAFTETSALRAGADVLIVSGRGGFTPTDLDAVAAAADVGSASPVQLSALQLSDGTGALVAADVTALATLPTAAGQVIDPRSLAARVGVAAPGPELPPALRTLALRLPVTGLAVPPALSLLLLDENGTLRVLPGTVSLSDTATGAELDARFDLPPTGSTTRLVGWNVDLPDGAIVGSEAVVGPATFLSDSGDPVFADRAWAARVGDVLAPPDPLPDGGFRVVPGVTEVRMAQTGEPAPLLEEPPVAISAALADRYGLAVGDPISFGIERVARYTGVVAAIVPSIPGTAEPVALFVDLTVLQMDAILAPRSVVPPTAIWVDQTGPGAAAEVRRVIAPSATVLTAASDDRRTILAAPAEAMTVVAIVTILLSALTLVVVAGGERRSRVSEVAALRALGLRPTAQAALRGRQWTGTIVIGLLIGAVAGCAVVLLTVRALARAAVPDAALAPAMSIQVDSALLSAGLCALVLLGAAVVAGVVVAVRRDARRIRGDGSRR
ncbi:hypothetical protein HDC37_001502 [Microbacterium sp. AK009]|uniref:hypothetical protein n=1 Tax=Microbacterium sp. AK009 TaxID=2723068 RepID=UPI0015CDC56B|nr:hypothetical protein [Microbacterium sp. AK009]NYF16677.1 hypothetical protein [Microbacterium sp. AK009]